jgi:release factor glutamine methyltransferase
MSVLRAGEAWLEQRGVDAPRRSLELLLGKVLGLDRLRLYLAHDRPLAPEERTALRALVARRGRGEPVAYLLGSWSFRGLELEVSPAVLVPRPETEALVDLALQELPRDAAVVDLGTGSGALAIAIAAARPDVRVVATDQSRNALLVAARNVERHGLSARIELLAGDWWAACADAGPFDLLVSNPPYVDPARTDLLAPDVAQFEPPLALFAGRGDPASSYRAILAGIATHLRPGARLCCETGVEAAEPALAMFQAHAQLQDARLLPDLAGQPRYLLATRR